MARRRPDALPDPARAGHSRQTGPGKAAGVAHGGPENPGRTDRPLPAHLPARPRPARGLPAGAPARAGLQQLEGSGLLPGQPVLEGPRVAPSGPRQPAPARRGRRRLAAATADPAQDGHDQGRPESRRLRSPGLLRPVPDQRAVLLPRPLPVGDRRSGPLGALGRALPRQPGRNRQPQVRTAPQSPHGRPNPRTAPRPSRSGPNGRPAPQDSRGTPAGRPASRTRRHLHRRRPDADAIPSRPEHDCLRDSQDLGGRSSRRQAPRPLARGGVRVLGMGRGGGPPIHWHPDRGASGDRSPQPGAIPAADHRRDSSRSCRSLPPRPTPNGSSSSAPSLPTCSPPSSSGSANPLGQCPWSPPTTGTNACGCHLPRCCSNADSGPRTARSATAPSARCCKPPSPTPAWSMPPTAAP